MSSNLMKGLKGIIGIGTVLGVLLSSKAAFAADCQQVMVFKDGIQEYAGPNTSTGVVVRGSATVRVRLYCTDGKQGSVYTSDLPKKQDQPKVSEKKGNIEVTLISAFAEFEGTVSVEAGKTKELTFTDGSGATYKVVVQGKPGLVEQPALDAANAKIDGKEDKGVAYTKPESDGRFSPIGSSYTKPESDEKYANKGDLSGLGSEGRIRLEISPLALVRPSFDPMFGIMGKFRYRVGKIEDIGFEFLANPGWAHGSLPTRQVQGVPYTEQSVAFDTWFLAVMGMADFPVGKRVNFGLGGGLRPAVYYYPGTSVGQEANGGTVWGVHDSTFATLLLQAQGDFRVYLSSDNRRGLYMGLAAIPGIGLIPIKGAAGGTEKKHRFEFVADLILGYAL